MRTTVTTPPNPTPLRPSAAEPALIRAVTDYPDADVPRMMAQDEMRGSGRWSWAVVYGYVLANPAADGLRLLAADYLDVMPETKCLACVGGTAQTLAFGGRISRSGACPVCDGTGMSGPQQRRDARFIRAQVALSRLPVLTPLGCQHRDRQRCSACDKLRTEIAATVWDGGLGAVRMDHGVLRADYVRGFVGAITCPSSVWVARHAAIRAEHPITAVTLNDWPDVGLPSNRPAEFGYLEYQRACIVGMPEVATGNLPILPSIRDVPFDQRGPDRSTQFRVHHLFHHYWPGITIRVELPPEPEPDADDYDQLDYDGMRHPDE